LGSPARLLQAFDTFDEATADRELEHSLAIRSVERSIEELLLPAVEMAARRPNHVAELEYACRWSTGWLHSARRLAPAASLREGVMLLDSGSEPGVEAVYVHGLELFLRRAGLRVLLLSADLPEQRFASALRALSPAAVVLCGEEASLDVLGGPLRRALRNGSTTTRILGYRSAQLVAGSQGVPLLGSGPGEGTARLLAALGAG
jgi:MerR family transcriptional regulator, light-induced transcriptional regulator